MFKEKNYKTLLVISFGFIIPISLITGPALPDIIVSTTALMLILIYFNNTISIIIKRKFFLILILFWLFLIFSSLVSDYVLFSLKSSVLYLRFIFFSIFMYLLAKNKNFLYALFYGFSFTYLVLIIDSAYLITFNYEIDNNYKPVSISNIFSSEKKLGSFLSRSIPFYLGLFFLLKFDNKAKYFVISILTLVSILIISSGERVSIFYLSMFVIISFMLLKNLRFFIIASLFISLVLITLSGNLEPIKKRIIDYSIYQSSKLDQNLNISYLSNEHSKLFTTSYKMFLDNKIMGIGPNNFRNLCMIYVEKQFGSSSSKLEKKNTCSTSPHNTYFQLLSETGLVGFTFIFIFFLFISYLILKEIYLRNFLSKKYLSDHLVFFKITLLISLWPFVPTGNFFNNWLSIMYFIPIGITFFYYYDFINNRNTKEN